jgi:hypothetical protein
MSVMKSNSAALARISLLVTAIEKYFQGQTLTLNGVKVTAEEAIQTLQAYAAALTTSTSSHAAWTDTVEAARKLEPGADSVILGIEGYVRVMYGNTSAVLTAFGMTPRKPGKKTVAVKQEAVEKSLATRVARHTTGSKQKAKIHGEVPPPPVTPEVKPK